MSMALSKEEALAFLTPERKAFIWQCVRGGLDDYDKPDFYGSEARRDHSTSVRAMLRNCHIVGRAARMAVEASHLKIRVVNRRGRALFVIAGQVNLSFKKLNRKLRASKGHTRQALNFNAQQLPEQLVMDLDAKPVTNVIAGYRSDIADATFEIYLTCPDGDANKWDIKLSESEVRAFVADAEAASDDATYTASEKRPRRFTPHESADDVKDAEGESE